MPASPEVVAARDAAILEALRVRSWTEDALVDVLPQEPGLTEGQRRRACSSALVRLRLKKQVEMVEGAWRRV